MCVRVVVRGETAAYRGQYDEERVKLLPTHSGLLTQKFVHGDDRVVGCRENVIYLGED